jgi:hypothetical protein
MSETFDRIDASLDRLERTFRRWMIFFVGYMTVLMTVLVCVG